MVLMPGVLWAQRKDRVFLTIDVQDTHDPLVKISNDESSKSGKLLFKGKAVSHATDPEEHEYELSLDLFDEVDESKSQISVNARNIVLVLMKKGDEEHWPRLLKQPGKPPNNVKVDWDKWVDEDEEGEAKENFDFGNLQGLQNFGGGDFSGLGGDLGDEEDSDDDDEDKMPPLEESVAPEEK